MPKKNKSTPPQVWAGNYPRFNQDPRSLVGQEYGRSGLTYYLPGWIRRDFLPQLQGRRLWLVYEEMGPNDATWVLPSTPTPSSSAGPPGMSIQW